MHLFSLNKYIPKKYLGQNFLQDRFFIDKIVTFINPIKTDTLVEIGPGLAALTQPICNFLDHLVVIEIDNDLLLLLKQYKFYKKLSIFKANAMYFNFKKLSIQKNNILRIFGNIPYNISVKLILYLMQFRKYIFDIHFMVQKDVADRLVATPGNKKYGRLSIIAQCYYNINILFNIPPNAFFPRPKVNSSFVKITPKIPELYPWNKINNLKRITCLAFQKRRKILKNSFLNIFDNNVFIKLNINSNLRPENISIYEYCKLANLLQVNIS